MIEWNVAHGIYFLRLSSEIFPFAAHEKYGYSLDYAAEELKVAGDTAKRLNVRLTTHPGQFTQLGVRFFSLPECKRSELRLTPFFRVIVLL